MTTLPVVVRNCIAEIKRVAEWPCEHAGPDDDPENCAVRPCPGCVAKVLRDELEREGL